VKCIVKGGSGFIETLLVEELIKRDHEVLIIDIRPPILDSHKAHCQHLSISNEMAAVEAAVEASVLD